MEGLNQMEQHHLQTGPGRWNQNQGLLTDQEATSAYVSPPHEVSELAGAILSGTGMDANLWGTQFRLGLPHRDVPTGRAAVKLK